MMCASSDIYTTTSLCKAAKDESMNLKPNQIPRFPSNLDRIGKERGYITPTTVSIGPYYHAMAASELKLMEEIKRKAVDSFFQGVDKSQQEATFVEIKSMAGRARCCYNDTHALRHIANDELAKIMFVDGCFLVQFIDTLLGRSGDASFRRVIHPHTIGVLRDMMLLENQIPWAVMEVLMPLKSLKVDDVVRLLVDNCLHGTTSSSNTETEDLVIRIDKDYKPSHLLCLIRFFEAASGNTGTTSASSSNRSAAANLSGKAVPIYTSAAELAELGIDLEASRRRQFSAMAMEKGPFLFGKLSLAPLNLDATIYCWLVNMAAFEMWTETAWEESSVNSYLAVLSLLMHREEDVRELRVKRIVHGTSSDRQALEFFKDLAPGVSEGNAYWRLIGSLEEYRQKRWLWIAVYRFVYKNSKTIAAVLSTVGVLVGIFKALLSLKPQPAAY